MKSHLKSFFKSFLGGVGAFLGYNLTSCLYNHYDVDKLISDMQKEKLHIHAPYWNYSTTRLLKDGKISNGTVLTKAMELCKLTTGECHWPHIPEEYWEQAIKELYKLPNSSNFPLSPF